MTQKKNQNASAESDATLQTLREAIDAVDRDLLEALCQRARLVLEVGELKAREGISVYSPARERDLIAALAARNPGPFPQDGIGPVFREIISATRSLERRLRVAYLGPEGSNGHIAALGHFGSCVDFVPVGTNTAIFRAVEKGDADRGVVPIENTTQGIVTEAFDVLAQCDVAISGETSIPIRLHLLNQSGSRAGVERIASHPQALAQCRRWLEEHLPDIPQQEVASTSLAAELAGSDPGLAAVASELAAEVVGLRFAGREIQDRQGNMTRFLIVGGEASSPSGDDLTLAVFTVKSEAGALHRLIEPFAKGGVSLAAIQSRPLEGRNWEYRFYLDIEGHRDDPRVAEAIGESERQAHSCRILGSFPRSRRAKGSA